MKHKKCGGTFEHWIIEGHWYSFFRCDKCHAYLGANTQAKVKKLMMTKVHPYQRKV